VFYRADRVMRRRCACLGGHSRQHVDRPPNDLYDWCIVSLTADRRTSVEARHQDVPRVVPEHLVSPNLASFVKNGKTVVYYVEVDLAICVPGVVRAGRKEATWRG
jgi:hypothetical protein